MKILYKSCMILYKTATNKNEDQGWSMKINVQYSVA